MAGRRHGKPYVTACRQAPRFGKSFSSLPRKYIVVMLHFLNELTTEDSLQDMILCCCEAWSRSHRKAAERAQRAIAEGIKSCTTGGEIFGWNRAMGTAIRLRENGLTFPIGKHGANDRRVISGRDAARESRSRKRPQADGMDMKLPNKTPRGDYLPGVSFIP